MYLRITILIAFFACCIQASELLYISSGESIDVKKIDPQTGKLNHVQKIKLAGLSSFTICPKMKFLYAQSSTLEGRKRKPAIATFAIANDGTLKVLNNSQVSTSVTELKTDRQGNYLAGTRSGNVFIWKLDSGILNANLVHTIKLEKKTHAVRFSPDNRFLYVPATAPNKVFQLSFDENSGAITLVSSANGPSKGASQPMHLTFHPALNMIYTTQERLNPGIAAWKWERKSGSIKLIQNIVTSENLTESITVADIHLSPDGSFAYISSRGKDNEKSEIISFKIERPSGQLSLAGRIQCEKVPRSFCINLSGSFMYVAGQGEDKLGVYKIDKDTGHLKKIIEYDTDSKPIWVETSKLTN